MKKEHQRKDNEGINIENQNDIQHTEEHNAKQAEQNTDSGTENLSDYMAKLEENLSEVNDKYTRLAAEFDNYRKRTLKERMDMMKYGGEDVIKDLLPILDDLDRNAQVMEKVDDINVVREGITLIQNKLFLLLQQKGLAEIEAQGIGMDTDLHDAVTTIPAPDTKLKGKVVDVIQKGYKLSDKVIRHAKVVVGE